MKKLSLFLFIILNGVCCLIFGVGVETKYICPNKTEAQLLKLGVIGCEKLCQIKYENNVANKELQDMTAFVKECKYRGCACKNLTNPNFILKGNAVENCKLICHGKYIRVPGPYGMDKNPVSAGKCQCTDNSLDLTNLGNGWAVSMY